MENKWVKILALMFANGLNYLIGFLVAPLLSRSLSYEDNGTYNQLLLLINLFSLIAQLGLTGVITVFLANSTFKASETFYTVIHTLSIAAIGITAILACSSFYLPSLLNNPALGDYLLKTAPALFFQVIGSCTTFILIYYNKIRTVSFYTVLSNLLRIGGMLYCIQVLKSVDALVWWFIGFTVISNLSLFVFIPKELRSGTFGVNKALRKEMLQKSWPLLVSSLLGMGIFYIDGFMVSSMLSIKEYALYRNGAIEIPFIATIYNSVAAIMLPDLARLYNNDNHTRMFNEKRQMSRYVTALVFPVVIALIVFSDKLIPLYLSDKYYQSFLVFAIYNIATLVRINDYQDLLTIKGRSGIILKINAMAFVLNIICNFFFIKAFGITGSAAVYTGTICFVAFSLTWFTTRTFRIPLKQYFDVGAVIMMLGTALGINLLTRFIIPDSMWLFGLALSILLTFSIYFILNYVPLKAIFAKLKNVKV